MFLPPKCREKSPAYPRQISQKNMIVILAASDTLYTPNFTPPPPPPTSRIWLNPSLHVTSHFEDCDTKMNNFYQYEM